ncbi:MAG TPA: alkaline phosphatase family protein [Thermomicrobiaceae bacterium]|nr:alkaline phosphatase family protein [Thermomicrobiaceae bacterium]
MTHRISRRRLLGSSAALAAAAALPPSLRQALAAPAPQVPDSLEAIEHVVFLIQENRAFDHYFGTLRGVRGFADPNALPGVFSQPDPGNPDGYELPFHLDTATTSAAAVTDVNHSWGPQHQSWNNGAMNNWLPAHRAADGDVAGPMTMGYYTRADLPFYYTLADAFTICDRYHCSVLGPTYPNRLYSMTGTIDPDGAHGGPAVDNHISPPYSWTTYPERLQQAGVSWRIYQSLTGFGDNVLPWFKQYQEAPAGSPLRQRGLRPLINPLAAIRDDVRANRLPQVSWILAPFTESEHPSYLPAAGANFTSRLLEILAGNQSLWSKTVVFFTYDENGGFFDHVPPPTAPPGTPGEYLSVDPLPDAANGIAGPIGLGFRVPMIVVSPWSQGGYVNSDVFDHTSLLRFLEARFGVEEPNISAWRRSVVGDLTSTLRLAAPPVSTFPPLPDPRASLRQQFVSSRHDPAPTVPNPQTMPQQEPGTRPSD